MGSALLRGWLSSGIPAAFAAIEPHDIDASGAAHFRSIEDAGAVLGDADVVILAVKPQVMAEVCARLAPLVRDDALFLSIAAGQSLAALESHLGGARPVIRAMPNTPAAIGKGMSVCAANARVSSAQRALATLLLETAGRVEWLADEALMDAVTALSGSGPAYVFYLVEILTEAGRGLGLPEEMAAVLARQTVIGAAALAEAEGGTPAEVLRQNVTSPGGTTEAALTVLTDGRMRGLFEEALRAARDRGRALGG